MGAGTVSCGDSRLRFEATTGETFATAVGTYSSDGHIEVDRLIFDAEETPVDWRLLRKSERNVGPGPDVHGLMEAASFSETRQVVLLR